MSMSVIIARRREGTCQLIHARSLLLTSKTYLGHRVDVVKECVKWIYDWFGNRLFMKESIKALYGVGDNEPPDVGLEAALLSVIVAVDSNDCWLTPCGDWNGRSKDTKKFEDLKLSFVGKSPLQKVLMRDFERAVDNCKRLMEDVVSSDAKSMGFLMTEKEGRIVFRFQHTVFEVRGG